MAEDVRFTRVANRPELRDASSASRKMCLGWGWGMHLCATEREMALNLAANSLKLGGCQRSAYYLLT